MLHSTQIEIVEVMLRKLESGISHDAGKIVLNPTNSYVNKELAEKDWVKC